MTSIHQFKIESIEGAVLDFAQFKGKKILVVNVASECGYTPQYAQLEELYQAFQHKLVVVGCPCNDFGNQEPADNATIQAFCTVRYGVSFPLSQKLHIVGDNAHPLYQWLTKKTANGFADTTVTWNFYKFLLDEQGYLLQSFPSNIQPIDDAIVCHLS